MHVNELKAKKKSCEFHRYLEMHVFPVSHNLSGSNLVLFLTRH